MISLQVKGVKEALLKLPNTDQVRKAAATALNRVGRGTVTEADRGIREEYTAKRADIRKDLTITKADPGHLQISLLGGIRPLALPKFQVRATRPKPIQGTVSVKVRVKKGGALKPIQTAFQATMRSGHVGIFRRVGRPRLPILELKGPSVKAMASNEKVIGRIRARADREFEPEFKRNLERMKGKGK